MTTSAWRDRREVLLLGRAAFTPPRRSAPLPTAREALEALAVVASAMRVLLMPRAQQPMSATLANCR